jgi:hypothetical protein
MLREYVHIFKLPYYVRYMSNELPTWAVLERQIIGWIKYTGRPRKETTIVVFGITL